MAQSKSKKRVAKKSSKRGRKIPSLNCPVVVDLRFPYPTDATGKIASLLAEFRKKVAEWKEQVKAHYAAGGKASDVPQFDPKHFVNPNPFAMTPAQLSKLGEDDYIPPRYNPVIVDLIHEMNATSIRRGLVSKHPRQPSNWDEKNWGSWMETVEYEDGSTEEVPSGWFVDKLKPRRCHSETAEKLIEDASSNIVTIGNYRYVVGDGTHIRCAPMLVWATSRGIYRAGDVARKRLSIAGNKDVVDVVFRIEDRPNNGGGVTVKANWGDVNELVFMPGQALTAGFLFDADGNRLSAKAIRALDNAKGIKFKTVRQVLGEPLVGKAIPDKELWAEIQTIEGKSGIKKLREREGRSSNKEVDRSPRAKAMYNLMVTCRVSPAEAFPFGLRAAQADMVPYIVNDENGHLAMGVVIGDRSNFEYNVGVYEARSETEEVEETSVETPVRKAKKPEKKAKKPEKKPEKKAEKPEKKAEKAEKPKKAEKVEKASDDVSPTIEHDTSDEVTELEVEVQESVVA